MEKEALESYQKAMDIAEKAAGYAKSMKLENKRILDIAEELENVIRTLGGKPAWPVNILINDIAAHYTPDADDAAILKENELVKIDLGVHVNGYICDKAFSIFIGGKTHPLIEASEKGLGEALKLIKPGTKIWEISEIVENTVNGFGFNTIRNLCGHAVERYNQHAHPSVPNGKNTIQEEIQPDTVIAMEVFATNGSGWVKESSPTMIFKYRQDSPVRMWEARLLLEKAKKDFETLPFGRRWVKDMSTLKFNMAIAQLLEVGALHDYPPLREEGNGLVAVTEETIIVK